MNKTKLAKMLETPEKYIPNGYYCCDYINDTICPFWDLKDDEYPEYENGYCYFLGKSDWDLNEESFKTARITSSKNEKLNGRKISDLIDDEIDPVSGKKCHFPMSLIWDQCKECNINMD